MNAEAHMGELALRRLRAGELAGQALTDAQAHAEGCGHCRSRLRALDEEQRRFEAEISFERFAAGVTRASRQPHRPELPRTRWVFPALAAAAMVTLVVAAGPLVDSLTGPHGGGPNGIKGGGAGIALRVSSGMDGPQRFAAPDAPELLAPGETVRIGYEAGGHGYLAALSVDAQGTVTPLYPEAGQSLRIEGGDQLAYLPGALEFTGEGTEQVFVILSDEPLAVDALRQAALEAFEASGGDVTRVTRLDVPGEQFRRTLLKP